MSAAARWNLLTVEEYLASEVESPFKREYVGGLVYPMAEERNAHHLIASNTLGAVGALARQELLAVQLGNQDSHTPSRSYAFLLSRRAGHQPVQSARRVLSR